MRVSAAFLASQSILALMSMGALEPIEGHLGSAKKKLNLRKIGAVVNSRTSTAGRNVLAVADFATETPSRPVQNTMACVMSPRTADTVG